MIEDSIIQVEDNRAVDNNGRDANYNTYKTFYFYDFYGGVNPMFTRDTDYVFDKASIIGEMAMYTNGTAGGTLMQNYTAETVKDFDYFSYLTDFDICTFDNRTNACPYLDLATNEMKIIVNSHQHKVCGQDKNTACTHTKLAAHSVYKPYNDYNHVKWLGFDPKFYPAAMALIGARYFLSDHFALGLEAGLNTFTIKKNLNAMTVGSLGLSYKF